MALKTPEINGARQELPCMESPEVNGARQEIAAVNKYVDGAWVKIWPAEEYIVKSGCLAEEYSANKNTYSSYHSNTHLDPDLTIYDGHGNGYYCVILGDYLESSDTGWTGGGRVVFLPAIDLTKYTTLWYEYEYFEMQPYSGSQIISSEHKLVITEDDSVYSSSEEIAVATYFGKSENGHRLAKIDLSELTGEGYLRLVITFDYGGCAYSNSQTHEVDIYNMWME